MAIYEHERNGGYVLSEGIRRGREAARRKISPPKDPSNSLHVFNGEFIVDHHTGAHTMETPIFSHDSVQIGCTKASVKALRELLKQWESRYGDAPWNRREGV